jgi:hypothetical protein
MLSVRKREKEILCMRICLFRKDTLERNFGIVLGNESKASAIMLCQQYGVTEEKSIKRRDEDHLNWGRLTKIKNENWDAN